MSTWLLLCIAVVNCSIMSHENFIPRKNKKIRIAVIGGGIGGSSFVHYVNKLNDKYGAIIDIYEQNDYVGGRTKSVKIDEDMIELGASIAIKDNQYVYNLVNELQGLSHQFIKQQRQSGITVIWNKRDRSFDFMSYNSDSWLNTPYTLWHFGPKKLFDLFMLSRSFVSKMNKIYQYQNESKTFTTAQQFYEIMDVYQLSQINCLEYLSYHLYGEMKNVKDLSNLTILNELVMGMTRVNYNQDFYDLSALVCMTSISALGNGGSDAIWNVKQGNQYLSSKMIENAIKSNNKPEGNSIKLKLSNKVVSIIKLDVKKAPYKYKYQLSCQDLTGSNIYNRYYDVIVIATPLSIIDCKFIDFDTDFYTNLNIAVDINYQTVYATLVKGKLNQQYFDENDNINSNDFDEINDLLISGYDDSNKERIFNSISRKRILQNNTNLYKLFSTKSINNENILNQIFSFYDNDHIFEQRWSAYPKYQSRAVFPRVIMDDDSMYYVNAVESGTSAMEILTISSKNIALLVHEFVLRQNEKDHDDNNSEHDEL